MTDGLSQSITGDGNTQIGIKELTLKVESQSDFSSLLATVVPTLVPLVRATEEEPDDTEAYKIEEKIAYNRITTCKRLLATYGIYGPQIDKIYEVFDNTDPGFTKSILKYFHTKYLLKLQELHKKDSSKEPLEIAQANADDILISIYEKVRDEIKVAKNFRANVEDIEICALALTCHAFIECKILEKPPTA